MIPLGPEWPFYCLRPFVRDYALVESLQTSLLFFMTFLCYCHNYCVGLTSSKGINLYNHAYFSSVFL
jgi:hypothetical protein